MAGLWPWMVVAGLGALHGLSPANGWMFALAWGLRERDAGRVPLALLSIATGHAASIAVVICVFAAGLAMDRGLVQGLAGALLLAAAAHRLLGRAGPHASIGAPASQAGIALWSFLMATSHGAGMMLVPALLPLCLADNPARAIGASGSLPLALAAVGVHMAAMLATSGVIAGGLCRGAARYPRLMSGTAPRQAWTAMLAVTGLLLVTLRP
ncbi:hypothetical protein [Solimonas sp. K1W22B-7]|uniref:hypothetical protein n=1 Tax=Solimonas sp. K1W22B-7 TaxID=2303331 RepID=UPI00196938C9|nr:hypothetical protein [Solimonas sp. K1W22B-7]